MIANRSELPADARMATPARELSRCYLAAPTLPDVLHEQIAYLLQHADHNAAGCSECRRLGQVVHLLMRPFE